MNYTNSEIFNKIFMHMPSSQAFWLSTVSLVLNIVLVALGSLYGAAIFYFARAAASPMRDSRDQDAAERILRLLLFRESRFVEERRARGTYPVDDDERIDRPKKRRKIRL